MNISNKSISAFKQTLKVAGLSLAVPFFIWLPLGLLPAIPSIIDVFGIDGLKLPTGIVIGGLLLAAIGFGDF